MYLCSNAIKSFLIFQQYAVRIIHVTLAIWNQILHTIMTYIDFLPIRGSYAGSSSKHLQVLPHPSVFDPSPLFLLTSILVSQAKWDTFSRHYLFPLISLMSRIETCPYWNFTFVMKFLQHTCIFFTCFALLPLFQNKMIRALIFIVGTMGIVKRERWRSAYNSAITSVILYPVI